MAGIRRREISSLRFAELPNSILKSEPHAPRRFIYLFIYSATSDSQLCAGYLIYTWKCEFPRYLPSHSVPSMIMRAAFVNVASNNRVPNRGVQSSLCRHDASSVPQCCFSTATADINSIRERFTILSYNLFHLFLS
jgi:hypothetical protein